MDQELSAAHQPHGLACANLLEQIRLAGLFRIAAQPESRPENMPRPEDGPVDGLVGGLKDLLHQPLVVAIAAIGHVHIRMLILRHVFVVGRIHRVGGDDHHAPYIGADGGQVHLRVVRGAADAVQQGIPAGIGRCKGCLQGLCVLPVSHQAVNALRQGPNAPGHRPYFVALRQRHLGQTAAELAAAADE